MDKKEFEKKVEETLGADYFEISGSRRYCFLPGSWMTFAYINSTEAYSIVRENLKFGGTVKKKMVSALIPLIRFTPFSLKLPYDKGKNFPGEVVITGRRLKSFDLENEKVYTIDDHSRQFIELREDLNSLDINVPELVYSEENIAVEEYVPVEQFDFFNAKTSDIVSRGLEQLFTFYHHRGVEKKSVEDIIDEDKQLVGKAAERLKDRYLVTSSHRDFHIGHLGRYNDKVYLFDWQGVGKEGFLMDDFFNLLAQQYKYDKDDRYFKQIKEGSFDSVLNQQIELFVDEFGIEKSEVFDYYVLFLCGKLSRKDKAMYRKLLREALKVLDDR